MNQTILSNTQVSERARELSRIMLNDLRETRVSKPIKIFPVPRGGVPVAYLLNMHAIFDIVSTASEADAIVDDIVDSGATRKMYLEHFPEIPFYALVDKLQIKSPAISFQEFDFQMGWVVFPWEETREMGIQHNITRLLQYVGEDPTRGGLLETPHRVAKAWSHWTAGYAVDIAKTLKTFKDGAESVDQMVVVKDIPFYSHCEHHLAPFFGTCTVAYIPNGKVVGLSKIPRVVQAFAQRLQVQERITNQIADAIMEHLAPAGVGVYVQARHLCMESRGICQQGHSTITTALRGELKNSPDAKAEFLGYATSK